MCVNEQFEKFKEEVANLVKEIVLNNIESRCLSINEYNKLYDLGFIYLGVKRLSFLRFHFTQVNRKDYPLFNNDLVYEYLDNHYQNEFEKTPLCQREDLFNKAVNDIWSKCLSILQKVIDFRNCIDWDREYPMIKQEYRINFFN